MEFITLSYNQEKFIISHLESIKYVIEKYAHGESCVFRLFDDASTDSTVQLVEKWIEFNKDVFDFVEINASKENRGTSNNYRKAIESVTSKKFKTLAGDDLYFDNDIFEIAGLDGLTLTPSLWFTEEKEISFPSFGDYSNFLVKDNQIDLQKSLLQQMRFGNCIDAPGSIIGRNLIDLNLLNNLKNYKYMEDFPTWMYLLNNRKSDLTIQIIPKPFVLYRLGSGVSTSRKEEEEIVPSQASVEYTKESIDFNNEVAPLVYDTSLNARIRKAINYYKRRSFTKYAKYINKEIAVFSLNMEEAKEKASEYLSEIQKRSKNYFEKY